MIPLLLLVLAAGPSGSLSGGRVPQPVTNTIYVAGTAETVFSITTIADVELVEAQWVTLTDGAGGAGTMAVAVKNGASAVCTVNVPCDAAAASVVVQSCASASIERGSAVTITVDRSGCVGDAPTGNLSYVVVR